MELAFEYSHVPKFLNQLLGGSRIAINNFLHFGIPSSLAEIKAGHEFNNFPFDEST